MSNEAPLLRLIWRLAPFGLPLVLSLVGYLACDPFRVLRRPATFYDGEPVILNRDVVSTEEFLRLAPTRPNAFVFGSSRSLAFRSSDWRRYLPSDARPFHFDAWLESVYGVERKVAFLDAHGAELRDVLFVIDTQGFERTTNQYSHLFIKHPRLSGEPALLFHGLFAGSFFANLFVVKYFDWKLFGTMRPYMLDVFDPKPMQHFPATNDLTFRAYEDELDQGEDAYYARRTAIFKRQPPSTAAPFLGATQVALLESMQRTFAKHRTRLRVLVSPLFGQVSLAEIDRRELERIFGRSFVFDHSGVNRFTENPRNFYEESHYRPHVARELLELAYGARGGLEP
jgi:hypothetical protein